MWVCSVSVCGESQSVCEAANVFVLSPIQDERGKVRKSQLMNRKSVKKVQMGFSLHSVFMAIGLLLLPKAHSKLTGE